MNGTQCHKNWLYVAMACRESVKRASIMNAGSLIVNL